MLEDVHFSLASFMFWELGGFGKIGLLTLDLERTPPVESIQMYLSVELAVDLRVIYVKRNLLCHGISLLVKSKVLLELEWGSVPSSEHWRGTARLTLAV